MYNVCFRKNPMPLVYHLKVHLPKRLDEDNKEEVESKIQKTTFTPQQLTSLPMFWGDSTNNQSMTVNEWFKRFELLAQFIIGDHKLDLERY